MRERAAQEIALIRAFEEADPEGLLLRLRARRLATDEARATGDSPLSQAVCRAAVLCRALTDRVPGIPGMLRLTRVSKLVLVPVAFLALVSGLMTNVAGPERTISLLAFPLLGLILWNLLVYLGLLVSFLRPRRPADTALDHPDRQPPSSALFVWLGEWACARLKTPDPDAMAIVARALPAYLRAWTADYTPVATMRIRAALHAGAALTVAGAVLGMYLRGLALAYQATWESTFLEPGTVEVLLRITLTPAATLLGIVLPDVAALEQMRLPGGAVTAAPWIHLWALTAGITVLLPRTLLLLGSLWVVHRRTRELPEDPLAGSFRILRDARQGAGSFAEIFPYSYNPAQKERDTALELALEVAGHGVSARIHEPTLYGAGTSLRTEDPTPDLWIVVFSLAQSPEREVHGEFLTHMLSLSGGRGVLAIVDRSPWKLRFDRTEDDRALERERTWERVIGETGLTAVHLDLSAELRPEQVAMAEQAVAADGQGA